MTPRSGASNSVFGSAPSHPLWAVVLDVLRNRSRTPLSGHTAVLFSTGEPSAFAPSAALGHASHGRSCIQ